jgi:CxxC motif-containing protein
MKREFVCIVCPQSCELTVEDYSGNMDVAGNQCGQGITFAEREVCDPQRILTTTVKLTTGGLLPVRSRGAVKKGEMRVLVEKLKTTVVEPPIKIGQTIVASFGENAVDIVATDSAT